MLVNRGVTWEMLVNRGVMITIVNMLVRREEKRRYSCEKMRRYCIVFPCCFVG